MWVGSGKKENALRRITLSVEKNKTSTDNSVIINADVFKMVLMAFIH